MTLADEWINTVIARAPELRRAGVLSIGFEGKSAVFAPGPPVEADDKPNSTESAQDTEEPSNPYENPNSYASGHVPTYEVDEELPEIPEFG